MTEKELLEYAAKAAGCELQQGYGETEELCFFIVDVHGWCVDWNPLLDDGDAFRLAVKLRICLGPNLQLDRAVAYAEDDHVQSEPYDPDPYAATRCAIVRAAAEIGRGMK